MLAWFVWFHALPPFVRRLIGAVLILGIAAGGIALAVHHERNVGYAAGYVRARDSVWTVEMRHRQVLQDSLEAISARSAKTAQDGTTALIPQRQRFDSAAAKRPTGLRMEPLPDSFARVPTADKVRVIVASTGDTVDNVPRQAALYWFRTDSLLGLAKTLLDKYAAANKTWSEAWSDEHNARIGADSLVALYAERLRSQTVHVAAKQHRLVYMTLGVVAGFIAAKRIH